MDTDNDNEAIELNVHGVVQGVSYRASTQRKARELGLRGTVENRPDGRVRIFAYGPPSALDRLEDWCRSGPPAAQVASVKREEADFSTPDDFEIRYGED